MQGKDIVGRHYLDGDYAEKNPHWDMEDSPWKAERVYSLLQQNSISPRRVAEVRCGAGGVLAECGYEVLDWKYTGAAFSAPQRSWKTRLAGLARRLAYAANKDAGVRLMGGETLMVLARARIAR